MEFAKNMHTKYYYNKVYNVILPGSTDCAIGKSVVVSRFEGRNESCVISGSFVMLVSGGGGTGSASESDK